MRALTRSSCRKIALDQLGSLYAGCIINSSTQGKLLTVTVGTTVDVAVDLRMGSAHFGQHVKFELSAEEKKLIWVPEVFAHGYYVLSEWAEIQYKTTDYYDPDSERVLLWNDPALSINWGIEAGITPIVSDKDSAGIPLEQAECFE